jgi:hypothetical protein
MAVVRKPCPLSTYVRWSQTLVEHSPPPGSYLATYVVDQTSMVGPLCVVSMTSRRSVVVLATKINSLLVVWSSTIVVCAILVCSRSLDGAGGAGGGFIAACGAVAVGSRS